MPKQTENLDTTWTIDTSDDVWTLANAATITVSGEPGIFVGKDFTGNRINVNGDIEVTGSGAAINIEGKYNDIFIGKTASLNALDTNTAIDVEAARTTLHNAGTVVGKVTAVGGAKDLEIFNTGTLTGGSAVFTNYDGLMVDNSGEMSGSTFAIRALSNDARIVNREGGEIRSEGFGIVLDNSEGVVIRNFGNLFGKDGSISALGDNETTVVNRGAIKGLVDLGDGNDRFDTRGGTVQGKVDGGDGDDTYLVGSQKIKIAEADDHGRDTVKSTVSYTLGANVEDLTLLGKKDIDGTGHAGSNSLYGNAGDNVLRGLGGEDYLVGGKGADMLFGGKGADIFDFGKGDGHDVIADFQDGKDLILSDFVKGQADFDDMMASHVKIQGDDLLIKYGDDTLLIRDMEKSDLTLSDFFTGL